MLIVKDTRMGKKVGRPKKETIGFENKKTIGYKNKKPNENVNENDNDNDNDNDNVLTTDVVNNNASDSCVDGLQKVIDFYNNNIGLLTPYGLEVMQDYLKEMDYQVIIYAMKKAVEANKRTIQYIKGTLNNWSKAGIKTLFQAEEENQRFKESKQPKEETDEERIARKIKEMEEYQNGTK